MSIENPSKEITRGAQFSPTFENGILSIHGREIVSVESGNLEEVVANMDDDQIVFYGDPVHGWLTAERASLLKEQLDSLVPEANKTVWIYKE